MRILFVVVLIPLLVGVVVQLIAPTPGLGIFGVWAQGLVFILMHAIVWVPAAFLLVVAVMAVQAFS